MPTPASLKEKVRRLIEEMWLYGGPRFTDKLSREVCLESWASQFVAIAHDAPASEKDNHHNALTCPYCNPKGLKLAPATAQEGK